MTKYIALRGNARSAPPNSAAAIREAMEAGVDGIFLDINYTKDERIVCNGEFESSAIPGSILTSRITFKELKEIPIGKKYPEKYRDEKILTIEEALDIIDSNVDIYMGLVCGSRHHPNIEERVLDILEARNVVDRTHIVSLDHMALKWLKKMNSGLRTVPMVYSRPAKPVDFAIEIDADGIASFHYFLTQFVTEAAHNAYMDVYAFPVNNRQHIQEMLDVGVDGILSPDVPLLKEYMAK